MGLGTALLQEGMRSSVFQNRPHVREVLGEGCCPPVPCFSIPASPNRGPYRKSSSDSSFSISLFSPSFRKVLKHILSFLCQAAVSEFEIPSGGP